MSRRIVSLRFPYVPLYIQVRHREEDVEALLDTGFDGDIVVPPAFIKNGDPPDSYAPWKLADGSEVMAATYRGIVRIGKSKAFAVAVTALGNEFIVGRGVTDRFRLILDRGKKIIVEI